MNDLKRAIADLEAEIKRSIFYRFLYELTEALNELVVGLIRLYHDLRKR